MKTNKAAKKNACVLAPPLVVARHWSPCTCAAFSFHYGLCVCVCARLRCACPPARLLVSRPGPCHARPDLRRPKSTRISIGQPHAGQSAHGNRVPTLIHLPAHLPARSASPAVSLCVLLVVRVAACSFALSLAVFQRDCSSLCSQTQAKAAAASKAPAKSAKSSGGKAKKKVHMLSL